MEEEQLNMIESQNNGASLRGDESQAEELPLEAAFGNKGEAEAVMELSEATSCSLSSFSSSSSSSPSEKSKDEVLSLSNPKKNGNKAPSPRKTTRQKRNGNGGVIVNGGGYGQGGSWMAAPAFVWMPDPYPYSGPPSKTYGNRRRAPPAQPFCPPFYPNFYPPIYPPTYFQHTRASYLPALPSSSSGDSRGYRSHAQERNYYGIPEGDYEGQEDEEEERGGWQDGGEGTSTSDEEDEEDVVLAYGGARYERDYSDDGLGSAHSAFSQTAYLPTGSRKALLNSTTTKKKRSSSALVRPVREKKIKRSESQKELEIKKTKRAEEGSEEEEEEPTNKTATKKGRKKTRSKKAKKPRSSLGLSRENCSMDVKAAIKYGALQEGDVIVFSRVKEHTPVHEGALVRKEKGVVWDHLLDKEFVDLKVWVQELVSFYFHKHKIETTYQKGKPSNYFTLTRQGYSKSIIYPPEFTSKRKEYRIKHNEEPDSEDSEAEEGEEEQAEAQERSIEVEEADANAQLESEKQ